MVIRRYGILAAMTLGLSTQACAAEKTGNETKTETVASPSHRNLSGKSIRVQIGDKNFLVDLYDNPTARDLLRQLPLNLTAANYPGYDEKVLRLSAPLSMDGAPEGDEPKIPEVGYYEPGNWIALYYGQIGYWPGKVPLGQIHASAGELAAIPENSIVKIEIAGAEQSHP